MVHPLFNGEHGKHLSKEGVHRLGDLEVGGLHAEGDTTCHVVDVLQDDVTLDDV